MVIHTESQPFHPLVTRWFRERFAAPTEAQALGWPNIASGKNTLIAAPTGSGKTLAAFLWSIDRLLRLSLSGELEDRTYVVYVSPLKALGNDIHRNLQEPLFEIQASGRGWLVCCCRRYAWRFARATRPPASAAVWSNTLRTSSSPRPNRSTFSSPPRAAGHNWPLLNQFIVYEKGIPVEVGLLGEVRQRLRASGIQKSPEISTENGK